MNANEPVAYVDNVWINRPDLAMDLGIGQMFSRCQLSDHQIPLYTHPVKELKNIVVASATCSCGKVMEVTNLQPVKELTDEEIANTWDDVRKDATLKPSMKDMQDFARAILRKAQE